MKPNKILNCIGFLVVGASLGILGLQKHDQFLFLGGALAVFGPGLIITEHLAARAGEKRAAEHYQDSFSEHRPRPVRRSGTVNHNATNEEEL